MIPLSFVEYIIFIVICLFLHINSVFIRPDEEEACCYKEGSL